MTKSIYLFLITSLFSATLSASAANASDSANIEGISFSNSAKKWHINYTRSPLSTAGIDSLVIDNKLYREVATMPSPRRGFTIVDQYNRDACHIARMDTYDKDHNLLSKGIDFKFGNIASCKDPIPATAKASIQALFPYKQGNKWHVGYTRSASNAAGFDYLVIDNKLHKKFSTMPASTRGVNIFGQYRSACHIARIDTHDKDRNLLSKGIDFKFGNIASCKDPIPATAKASIQALFPYKQGNKWHVGYTRSASNAAGFDYLVIDNKLHKKFSTMPAPTRGVNVFGQYRSACHIARIDTHDKDHNLLSKGIDFKFGNLKACNGGPIKDKLIFTSDNTGDYTCTGGGDQADINKALELVAKSNELTTVYLKGPMTCIINKPIVIPSNTKLLGDSTVKVQLVNNAGWVANKPLIRQKGVEYWNNTDKTKAIYGTESDLISNVEIGGFELTAGTQTVGGEDNFYYILMLFYGAKDLKIHDMNLHDGYGDMIRVFTVGNSKKRNENLKIYNNRIDNAGHEGLYIGMALDLEIYGNKITGTRTNAGIRVASSTRVSIHGNTISNDLKKKASGSAGIYIENDSSDHPLESADIYENTIFAKAGGIRLESKKGYKLAMENAHIHHNRLYKILNNTASSNTTLNGGIHILGANNTLIENNTIENSFKDGIVFEKFKAGDVNKYTTTVRNNIISNSEGFGINNLAGTDHTFINTSNILSNNKAGNYNNTSEYLK